VELADPIGTGTHKRRGWPHGDAIGKRIRRTDDSPWTTIVGVVGVVKEYGLYTETRMVVYYPHAQAPVGTMYIVARTTTDSSSTIDAMVRQVNALNPDVPV
jgi:hypothetical protein